MSFPILALVSVAVASESIRSGLEELFAYFSILFVDNFWESIVGTLVLAIFCATLLPALLVPTSYPGGPREPTRFHPKWKSTGKVDTNWCKQWKFYCDQESYQVTESQGKRKLYGESAGRQIWIHDENKEVKEDFKADFDVAMNPNNNDQVFRQSQQKQNKKNKKKEISSSNTPLESTCKAISFFQSLQCSDGHFGGDYGGPMFLLPGLIISCYLSDVDLGKATHEGILKYLVNHQQEDGGWGMHIEGASTMFGTVLNYCVLRILGVSSEESILKKAKKFIDTYGGPFAVPSWGKFWMACLGVYEWQGVNSIPPELWLLPRWFPFHPGKLWCHARMVYLPMSYLFGKRFTPDKKRTRFILELRKELYVQPYDTLDWNEARRCPISERDSYSKPSLIMKIAQSILSYYEKYPFQYLRNKGLQFAMEYIQAEDRQTNYICIGPVNKCLNMLCNWHVDPKGEAFQNHIPRLVDYLWVAEDGVRMQGYNGSQMWDTSFAVQAILDSGKLAEEYYSECLILAHEFMDRTQIKSDEEEYEKWFRHVSKGGWPFSTAAHGWPISDCTAEGLKAMLRLKEMSFITTPLSDERFYDAVNVILTLQNTDGGWATYENNRGYRWYEYLNPSEVFGDIMIDYSYVECSSACMSALSQFASSFPNHRSDEIRSSLSRANAFLKSIQRKDGSWYGSWGVCFTYGTWFGISGLIASGESFNHSCIQKACSFLLLQQNEDGGWTEAFLSCADKQYTPSLQHGSQVVSTSWALLGLMHGGHVQSSAVHHGIQFLRKQQLPNGDWKQEGISGVFNRSCGITYSNYRNIFPIWALGMYTSLTSSNSS